MLLGPDRLHFSSDEIIMKIPCADHMFLIKHSMASTSSVWLSGIVKRGPLEIVQQWRIYTRAFAQASAHLARESENLLVWQPRTRATHEYTVHDYSSIH